MSKLSALATTLTAPEGKAVATLGRASATAQRQQGRSDQAGPAPGAANDGATPVAAAEGGVAHAILTSTPMKAVGRAFNFMRSVEQAFSSAVFGKIPFPAMPAVTIGASGFGLPHAHAHPPNLIPPAAPIPFPHLTGLLSIPILSGAGQTTVGGKPAARCGDMAVSVWCGGYFPLCEVFLGSATVWIEGARAARVGVDITKHCIFTTPKPSDPPIGPMVGMTVEPERSVMIGGVPMPSLTSLAMAGAFKLAFKGLGMAGRVIGKTRPAKYMRAKVVRFRATRYVNRMLRDRLILIFPDNGTPGFGKAAKRDLIEIATTPVGREMFDELRRYGKPIHLHPPAHNAVLRPGLPWPGPYAAAHNYADAALDVVADPNGPFVRRWDNGLPTYPPDRVSVRGVGKGSGTDIVYDPTGAHPNSAITPGSPSHAIAGHEIRHGVDNAGGRNAADLAMPDAAWQQAWQDLAEHNAVQGFEGPYRASQGLPPRPDYTVRP